MTIRILYCVILILFPLLITSQASLNMTLIGTWDESTSACVYGGVVCYNEVWGYVDQAGNEYAIICSPEEVHFIDLTTPSSPTLKQTFTGTGRSIWRDVKSYGNYVYVVHDSNQTSDNEGLWIFDMSALPSGNISNLGTLETHFGRAHNIFIDEDNARLYVAGSNTQGDGIIVYSLANPAAPTLLASVSLATGMGGYVHDLYVRNNIAYCNSESGGDGSGGMFAIDFTTPTAPSYLADINTGGYNHSSWMTDDGNYVVYATETSSVPLYIADVSDVSNGNMTTASSMIYPLLAPTHTNNIAHNPLIRGNYCFVSYYEDGVQVWDISDPANPAIAAYYDMVPNSSYNGTDRGAWGVYPFLPSGHILVSDDFTGLYVLRTNFSLPVELIEFKAQAIENGMGLISWRTETEENSKEFILERSTDGIDFKILARQAAKGNSSERSLYFHTDREPLQGTSYYRLKMVDLDGSYEYSNVVSLEIGKKTTITISPNPVKTGNPIFFQSDGDLSDDLTLCIYDISGKIMDRQILENPENQISFQMPELASGIYFIEFESGGIRHREKITVFE